MIVLGITGGVGAGKTTVMNYLEEKYQACTIQADRVGHLLMQKGNVCYQPVIDLLGREILNPWEEIDRKKVAGLVFSSPRLLMKLNQIIHPAVKEYVLHTVKARREEGCRLLVLEAALLLEEHYDEICDDLWYIYVDNGVRRARLKESRGYSDKKIDDILSNQLSDGVFRQSCRYVVENNGDFAKTSKQIDRRMISYGIM